MADLDAEYRVFLRTDFARRKRANPRYSRNAYAKFLGIDASYLAKIFSGKLLLSLELAEKIARKLALGGDARRSFLLSVAEEARCHALYLVDPSLTDCDSTLAESNRRPNSRKKRGPS